MKSSLFKKILSMMLALSIFSMSALALELDTSVDEEIRKHYNPSQIEKDLLPPLPKTEVETSSVPKLPATGSDQTVPSTPPPKTLPTITDTDKKAPKRIQNLPGQENNKNYSREGIAAIKIKKGTKFKVKSLTAISDYTAENATMSFKTTESVTKRYVTIPAGTIFKATIEETHPPQFTGNGGLIVINVDRMIFRGVTRKVLAKITKTNGKKIFVNNIKGKRQYWKSVANSTKPGAKFYRKSMRATVKLAQNPWTLILTPFTAVAGVVVYGVNIVGSPVFAIFAKGGRISIPAGTEFEIKLLEDVYLD